MSNEGYRPRPDVTVSRRGFLAGLGAAAAGVLASQIPDMSPSVPKPPTAPKPPTLAAALDPVPAVGAPTLVDVRGNSLSSEAIKERLGLIVPADAPSEREMGRVVERVAGMWRVRPAEAGPGNERTGSLMMPTKEQFERFHARVIQETQRRSAMGLREVAEEELWRFWIDMNSPVWPCSNEPHVVGQPSQLIKNTHYTGFQVIFKNHTEGRSAASTGAYNSLFEQQISTRPHALYNRAFSGKVNITGVINPFIVELSKEFEAYTNIAQISNEANAKAAEKFPFPNDGKFHKRALMYVLDRNTSAAYVASKIQYTAEAFPDGMTLPHRIALPGYEYMLTPAVIHEIGHNFVGAKHTKTPGDVVNEDDIYDRPRNMSQEHIAACSTRVNLPIAPRTANP